jgi:hypothetical protein
MPDALTIKNSNKQKKKHNISALTGGTIGTLYIVGLYIGIDRENGAASRAALFTDKM